MALAQLGSDKGSDNNPHYRDDGHQTPIFRRYPYTPKVLTDSTAGFLSKTEAEF